MKSLVIALMLVIIMTLNSFALVSENTDIPNETGPCLDQDVWVYIKHQAFYDPPSTVIVHVPKHSLVGDFSNCPAQDTEVLGQGRIGPGLTQYAGMYVVTLKKGKLNNSKNYTTRPPKKIEVPADNTNTWHVKK